MPAILVNGSAVEFKLEDGTLVVAGNRIEYEVLSSENGRIIARFGDSIKEILYDSRDGRFDLHLNGLRFTFAVATERELLLGSLKSSADGARSHSEVKAPMPGLVTKVCVAPGDVVNRGTTLVILEAMKMENEIRSPRDGTVAEVFVSDGMIVEKDQVLSSLE